MISLITILYRPRSTFDYLGQRYKSNLNAITTVILLMVGFVLATEFYFMGDILHWGLKSIYLTFLVNIGFVLVIAKYMISHILYWTSRLLKGNSALIDIKTVVAYSLIPQVFALPFIIFAGLTDEYEQLSAIGLYFLNIVQILLILWSLGIITLGLVKFNGYRPGMAVLNLVPVFALTLAAYLIWFA